MPDRRRDTGNAGLSLLLQGRPRVQHPGCAEGGGDQGRADVFWLVERVEPASVAADRKRPALGPGGRVTIGGVASVNDAKTALGQKILAVKKQKGLSWAEVAVRLGHSPVWACAACLGQMSMLPETAAKAATLFGLTESEAATLEAIPYRGSLPTAVPTDPLIYRFYELVMVYGTTWKELIQEEFGDGIMSAIDLDMTLERQPDQKGDRVRIGVSGKFLPYKQY